MGQCLSFNLSSHFIAAISQIVATQSLSFFFRFHPIKNMIVDEFLGVWRPNKINMIECVIVDTMNDHYIGQCFWQATHIFNSSQCVLCIVMFWYSGLMLRVYERSYLVSINNGHANYTVLKLVIRRRRSIINIHIIRFAIIELTETVAANQLTIVK